MVREISGLIGSIPDLYYVYIIQRDKSLDKVHVSDEPLLIGQQLWMKLLL